MASPSGHLVVAQFQLAGEPGQRLVDGRVGLHPRRSASWAAVPSRRGVPAACRRRLGQTSRCACSASLPVSRWPGAPRAAATVHETPELVVVAVRQPVGEPRRQLRRGDRRVTGAGVEAVPPHGEPSQPVGRADRERRHPPQHGGGVVEAVGADDRRGGQGRAQGRSGWPGGVTSAAARRQYPLLLEQVPQGRAYLGRPELADPGRERATTAAWRSSSVAVAGSAVASMRDGLGCARRARRVPRAGPRPAARGHPPSPRMTGGRRPSAQLDRAHPGQQRLPPRPEVARQHHDAHAERLPAVGRVRSRSSRSARVSASSTRTSARRPLRAAALTAYAPIPGRAHPPATRPDEPVGDLGGEPGLAGPGRALDQPHRTVTRCAPRWPSPRSPRPRVRTGLDAPGEAHATAARAPAPRPTATQAACRHPLTEFTDSMCDVHVGAPVSRRRVRDLARRSDDVVDQSDDQQQAQRDPVPDERDDRVARRRSAAARRSTRRRRRS